MQNDILASLTRLSDDDLVARLKGLVARAARRFPVILDLLAEGSVNLTAVRLLAPHLTPSNHREVLGSARGKRKPEVEEIVATLSPRPDVPASVRRLSTSRPASVPLAAPVPASASPAPAAVSVPAPAPGPVPHPLPVGLVAVTPLSPDCYRLQLTIGGDTHVLPAARKRVPAIPRPRSSVRSGCGISDALGGEATVDQIQLRCRRHNDYEGRLYFGKRRRGGDSGIVREEPARYRSCRSTPGALVLEQVDFLIRREACPPSGPFGSGLMITAQTPEPA